VIRVPSTTDHSDEEIRSILFGDGADQKVWWNVAGVLNAWECETLMTDIDTAMEKHDSVPGQNGRTVLDHEDVALSAQLWGADFTTRAGVLYCKG
jgi:hypothetical protein